MRSIPWKFSRGRRVRNVCDCLGFRFYYYYMILVFDFPPFFIEEGTIKCDKIHARTNVRESESEGVKKWKQKRPPYTI